MKLRFKGNESFSIRNGWFDKAFSVIAENNTTKIFSAKDGVTKLGIGSNMVVSLKYWLKCSNLLSNDELTPLAELIMEKDPYFEKISTWWIIHYNLVTNLNDCSLFYVFFNGIKRKKGTKEEFAKDISNYIKNTLNESPKDLYIDSDLSVCIKSYSIDPVDKEKTPEENLSCPLTMLGLLKKTSKGEFEKTEPNINTLDINLIYLSLLDVFESKDEFLIDDALTIEKGPGRVFNLTRSTLFSYIEKLQKEEVLSLNRTAGLNVVYFKEKKQREDIIKEIIR